MNDRSFYHMRVVPIQHSLLLLRLPGNVEREVYQIKNEILRISGSTSCQVPPILPLASVRRQTGSVTKFAVGSAPGSAPESATKSTVVDSLPQKELEPLSLGPIAQTNGYIVISTVMDDRWSDWIEGELTGMLHNDTVFPLQQGFLIASTVDVDLPTCRNTNVTVLPKKASVLFVEYWSLESHREPWWIDLRWSVEWSRRIKLRG